ncbi:MAG: magnesium and cobalt transport protein CorA [Actinomycetota bacterium]|nr:magnesium and cobalt transport protein CorA [Actinomycetota bacterium]
MTVVDNAVYADGRRCVAPESLEMTYELLREQCADGSPCLAWIGLYRPDEQEIASVAAEFGLHKLAVEDAVHAHQRPKLERYGDTLFAVLRPARYVDPTEVVEIGELHVFMGQDFVITIRHADEPDLAEVRQRLEAEPGLLKRGPLAVLYAILDRIVDDYLPVLLGLRNDIGEIEDQVFGGEPNVSRRIYQLSGEVIEFQRACEPLLDVLDSLISGFKEFSVDVELQRQLRDVQDHAVHVVERVDAFRQLLSNALTVNSTLVAQQQNEQTAKLTEASLAQSEEVKKISSWAAILFAPSVVGTIYGMNFTHMPELNWTLGYPMALGLMAVVAGLLYLMFRRRGWL